MRLLTTWRIPLPLILSLALHGCAGPAGVDSATEPELAQADADGDSILDLHEGTGDTDGDGTPDFQDDDSDADSIFDRIEAGDDDLVTLPVDSDRDGIPDFVDLDSDGNCVGDAIEAGRAGGDAIDTDGDGRRDFQDTDNDGDGILDIDENESCESLTDSDGDGVANYLDLDSDNDGIGDRFEGGTTDFSNEPVDTDDDGVSDFLDQDSDNDGLLDSDEGGTGGDITVEPRDTDRDGQYDYADADADGDSLPDATEIGMGTDPYDPDSDGDGFTDGGEVVAGTDPLDPTSVIEGIFVVVPERTEVEESFEFELIIRKSDIAFLLDTSDSMGDSLAVWADEFWSMAEELSELLPDAAFGVGGYDDYAYGGFGSAADEDKPFYLRQQITTELGAVTGALGALRNHGGDDLPQSAVEALYQAASGAGYDQDCDGSYDDDTDVYPFLASKHDPFGGGAGQHYDADTIDGGTIGGFGFRDHALPIILIAGNARWRDPDDRLYDDDGGGGYGHLATPGGCPIDAGTNDAVRAFSDIGAYVGGVAIRGEHTESWPFYQLVDFGWNTGSRTDLDGDGDVGEELIHGWAPHLAPGGYSAEMVLGIIDLVDSIRFSRVDLSVEGDPYGFVTTIEPAYYDNPAGFESGAVLTFSLTFRGTVAATSEDQIYKLTLNVLGDETVLLDSLDIIVVIPGTAF